MKKFKLGLTVAAVAACFTVPSFASEGASALSPKFTLADGQLIFANNAQPMELAELSTQEMKDTEGGFLPLVVRGATYLPQVYNKLVTASNVASQPGAGTAASAAYKQVRPTPKSSPPRNSSSSVNQIPRS